MCVLSQPREVAGPTGSVVATLIFCFLSIDFAGLVPHKGDSAPTASHLPRHEFYAAHAHRLPTYVNVHANQALGRRDWCIFGVSVPAERWLVHLRIFPHELLKPRTIPCASRLD